MSEEHTPGPWEVRRGYSGRSWTVWRSVGRFPMGHYLTVKGTTSHNPSRFKSEDAARAAIARADKMEANHG